MNNIKKKHTAVIFAHYDMDNIIDDYVINYLNQLQTIADSIFFVSTAQLNEQEIKKISLICKKIIVRENTGYDFMSWKIALQNIENLNDYDLLIMCNDSVYGPIYPIEKMFESMEKVICDFWGVTDNFEVSFHLQSYFIVFKKNIIISDAFRSFWENVDIKNEKEEIILKYEIGLTQTLLKHNFKAEVFVKYKTIEYLYKWFVVFIPNLIKLNLSKKININNNKQEIRTGIDFFMLKKDLINLYNTKPMNKTHILWKELIKKKKAPFIKIELLRDNPFRVNIKNHISFIKEESNYTTELITKHQSRIA